MYEIVKILHSLLRYAFVITALYAAIRAIIGWQTNKPYEAADNKASVFLIIFMHTQLLLGFLLYFALSHIMDAIRVMGYGAAMKVPELRFWAVEHISMTIIAVVFFQVGRILSKKASLDVQKHKKAAIFYTIGLVILMVSIPWPWSKISRAFLPF